MATKPQLIIQQPALPAYRLPLFRALAANSRISLMLVYASEAPALRNAEPDGFSGQFVPSWRIDMPLLGPLFWHGPQWRFANGKQAQLLILSANTRFLSLFPAILRAKFNRLPVAIWGHGYSKSPAAWRNWIRRLPTLLSDATVLYDPATKAALIEAGMPADKLFVAANGLDRQPILAAQATWLNDPNKLQSFRAKHELSAGPVLIHLSRLQAANRLDTAIRALPELMTRFPTIRLVVIGDGEPEQARLQALAHDLSVNDRIAWVGAIYDEAALAPWLLCADLFVYPQNVGLSLIHAFNYRLPAVLCGPIDSHNPEISAFVDGVNGRLAKQANERDFAATITELLSSPQTRQSMAQQAFETAAQQYNVQAMANTFSQLVDYLLTRRDAGVGVE